MGGLLLGSGVLVGDLLYGVKTERRTYSVDNYGEVWDVDLNVSLKLVDVFHRSAVGSSVLCRVCSVGGSVRECLVDWSVVGGGVSRSVRFLDNVHDASLQREVLCWRGVSFKSLRLEDAYRFGMRKYLSLENQHEYRVCVCDVSASSAAYHTKSLRPGDVLEVFQDNERPTSWEEFVQQLAAVGEEEPAKLLTESNTVIIL